MNAKILFLAVALLPASAFAIHFDWVPDGAPWNPPEAQNSSGWIEFTELSQGGTQGYLLGEVLGFSFSYGADVPVFDTVSSTRGLTKGNRRIFPAGPNGLFTSAVDDWTLKVEFDDTVHPFGNGFVTVKNGDAALPLFIGNWVRNDSVPDAGGTAGLLAIGLAATILHNRLRP